MFTLPLAAGDAATALNDLQNVVLAHKTTQKYFGSDVPAHAMLGEYTGGCIAIRVSVEVLRCEWLKCN